MDVFACVVLWFVQPAALWRHYGGIPTSAFVDGDDQHCHVSPTSVTSDLALWTRAADTMAGHVVEGGIWHIEAGGTYYSCLQEFGYMKECTDTYRGLLTYTAHSKQLTFLCSKDLSIQKAHLRVNCRLASVCDVHNEILLLRRNSFSTKVASGRQTYFLRCPEEKGTGCCRQLHKKD